MSEQGEVILEIEMEETSTKRTWGLDEPRPVSVDVIIIDDSGQGDFCLVSDPDTDGVPIVQDYIVRFDNYQNGVYSNGFLVSLSLPSDKGKNADWTFDDDPIWVKLLDKHGACPGNKNQNNPNILTNPSPTLSDGNRTLTFGNDNSTQQYFGFALRFANTKNRRTLTYDPIGDNQNGLHRA